MKKIIGLIGMILMLPGKLIHHIVTRKWLTTILIVTSLLLMLGYFISMYILSQYSRVIDYVRNNVLNIIFFVVFFLIAFTIITFVSSLIERIVSIVCKPLAFVYNHSYCLFNDITIEEFQWNQLLKKLCLPSNYEKLSKEELVLEIDKRSERLDKELERDFREQEKLERGYRNASSYSELFFLNLASASSSVVGYMSESDKISTEIRILNEVYQRKLQNPYHS